MSAYVDLPQFDEQGNNLVDPRDKTGRKTDYITHLHCKALERNVRGVSGMVLDLGCGYGRMACALRAMNWDIVGLDPSLRILKYASAAASEGLWCSGQLPDLPFADASFDVILAQNLLRVLHLNGLLHVAQSTSIPDALRAGGRLVIVDNIREGNPHYVSEDWIVSTFSGLGLRLVKRVSIRRSRWWGIYAVRYGLVPRNCYDRLAKYELEKLEKISKRPRFQYHNVLYIFEKSA